MPVVSAVLQDISLAEATTGWVGSSGAIDSQAFKQGSGSYYYQTPKNGIGTLTFTPAANINMTANYTTPHIYWTMRCDVFNSCELLNTGATNSGLMLRVTDGAGNFKQWHLDGKDTWDGSWKNFVLDLTSAASHSSSGVLNLADVDVFTWYTDNSNSGTIRIIDNTWMDAVRYGEGLQAESLTTEAFSFKSIADEDVLSANWYSVLQEADGVLFCQGGLVIGDSGGSANCNFLSLNETVYFLDRLVGVDHYFFRGVQGAGATDIDIQGLVCKTVGNSGAELDFSSAALTSFLLKSSTLINMGTIDFFVGSSLSTKFSGCGATNLGAAGFTADNCVWDLCGAITQSGASIGDCTISNSIAAAAIVCDDLANVQANSFESGGTGHGLEVIPVGAGPFTYSFLDNKFTGYAGVNGSTGNECILIHPTTNSANITINVGGLGDTPTIMEHADYTGTVTVNNTKTLTLTDIPAGVQVTLVNSSTRVELQNSVSTGVDISYGHSGGETVDILLMHTDYDPNASDIYNLALPSSDSSIKFNLTDDTNYDNP